MKEIKIIQVNGAYYLNASKYYFAEPDAVAGVHGLGTNDMFVIAKSYTEAQHYLVTALSSAGYYE